MSAQALESFERNIASETAPPLLKVALPFPHRLNCFIRLWLLKIAASTVFTINRLLYPPPKALRPTFCKRYSCRPTLETRIFFPPNYNAGTLLPLYFNIHGGGFALCDAQFDDEFCVSWAKRTGMLIVSLNYRKSPLHPFPTPVYDIAAVANAVLDDDTLPIDKSKLIIGGFSAGGNLALTASQLPGLKGNIKAALTFYPPVDFGFPPDVKLARRPYKNGPKDTLAEGSYWFDWGYVSPGQNRRDPLLSPIYAKKEDLPPWIYIIGAQWDMLRLEAQEMIHKLADEQDAEDQEAAFEKGTYKWTLAYGTSHGFTHHFGQKAAKRAKREQRCEEHYAAAFEWLKNGPLA